MVPALSHSGKVVDFAAARDEATKEEEKAVKQKPPTEKAQSLKKQVEAIMHQGSRPGEEDKDAGKRSTQVVGDRNGMNYKQVQRYICLTALVPDLQKMVDEKKLAFTPAVEISFIRPKNQRYIAVLAQPWDEPGRVKKHRGAYQVGAYHRQEDPHLAGILRRCH